VELYLDLKDKELKNYIYRIISYDRFLELFNTSKNTLVKPDLWDDNFENYALKSTLNYPDGSTIKLDVHKRMYGQCWTTERSSDAMWRIYSHDKYGLRIRTTIDNVLDSIGVATVDKPMSEYCIGKVKYESERAIIKAAKEAFGPNGAITFGSLFRSLLIKRKAFKHENEIRLLYFDWGKDLPEDELFKYDIKPHDLISQVMIDPRVGHKEFLRIKKQIIKDTGFQGEIKRSLLYKLPKPVSINVTQNITSQARGTP
tara:strand:- start:5692 stop:6462 length:771 start_codon:yes stop_codon:yes gene_type:complete